MKPSESLIREAAATAGYVLSDTTVSTAPGLPAYRHSEIEVSTPSGVPKGQIWLDAKGAVSGAWGKSGIAYRGCTATQIADALLRRRFGSGYHPDFTDLEGVV